MISIKIAIANKKTNDSNKQEPEYTLEQQKTNNNLNFYRNQIDLCLVTCQSLTPSLTHSSWWDLTGMNPAGGGARLWLIWKTQVLKNMGIVSISVYVLIFMVMVECPILYQQNTFMQILLCASFSKLDQISAFSRRFCILQNLPFRNYSCCCEKIL